MKGLREKFRNSKGFTLVEMLIVVAIISILVAISIPVIGSSLEKAREATDNANVRSAKAVAVIQYFGVDDGSFTEGAQTGTFIYDAANGTLSSDAVSPGYGKASANKDQVIQVEIDAAGKVTTKWVASTTDPTP